MSHLVKTANSARLLLWVVLASWIVGATAFSLLEETNLLDSLYWSMTTMSTVGYGDISPATAPGKMFTIAFQAWSIFYLIPCAVTNIIDKVRVDEHKMTHQEQEWLFNEVEQTARAAGRTPAPQPSDY